jgi:hypothetical protein
MRRGRRRAGAVPLAQVERVASRVGQRDPAGAVGQPGGAECDGPLSRRLVVADRQVEVELLRVLLPGPLGRDVVWSSLEGDLLPVRYADGDPAGVLPDDLPAGELGVEGGELVDVGCVERGEFQASCHGHAPILAPPSDKNECPAHRSQQASARV